MKFIEYGKTSSGQKLYAREDDDGLIRYTCLEIDPAYQAWFAEQNDSKTL